MGAMAELAGRIPIRNYLDHGPNVQPAEAVDEFLQKTYPGLLAKSKHRVVKAGDTLPMKGVEWRIVTAGAERHHQSVAWSRAPESLLRGIQAAHGQSCLRAAAWKHRR